MVEVCETYLDQLVPTRAHNNRVLRVRREPHTADPLSMTLVRDCKFAVTQSVPELDCAVARAGDDLTVIGREGDGEDVVGVADKTASGYAGGEFPETEGLVPGGREGICAVGGDYAVGNDV